MQISGKILKTQTEDGLELDAILFEPSKRSDVIVIHFHGKEGDFLQNHFIQNMADEYPKNNYAFMTASHRGKSYIADFLRKSATGYEYTQLGSAYDIFENCLYDIDAWLKLALRLGYKTVFLQQHSTPHKILWYVYKKHPESVKGLILISPADIGYSFEAYVPNHEKNLILANKLVKSGKAKQLMPVNLWSNCPVSAGVYLNWGSPNSNFQILNYHHPERGFGYYRKITLPMLAVIAEFDFSVGDPPEICMQLLEKNTSSYDFQSAVIKHAHHSYLGYEDKLTKTITDWLKTREIT
ncbi:hypothetical protein FJY90_06925 [Candidatus Gottesmanbacteria bacterium]|nr:hypothetical protein [Candidatus Gottesmanbacteria bacterium]